MKRRPEFNESTYGTHVTAELTTWLKINSALDGVPLHPSIREEAELGYDASFPAVWGMIYIQYKMPEFMRGARAAERPYIGSSYFRFPVKTDATKNRKIQHNTLCDLEDAQARSNGLVCYMAPFFLSEREFLARILSDTVIDGSIYASPCQLGRVKPESRHSYTYTGLNDVRPFSEPLPMRSGDFRGAVSRLSDLDNRDSTPLNQYLSGCWDDLTTVSGTELGSQIPLIRRVVLLASALNLQPVLVRLDR